MRIDGISLKPEVSRTYPRAWSASQVLGEVGWGNRGLSGLEYLYNRALRPIKRVGGPTLDVKHDGAPGGGESGLAGRLLTVECFQYRARLLRP